MKSHVLLEGDVNKKYLTYVTELDDQVQQINNKTRTQHPFGEYEEAPYSNVPGRETHEASPSGPTPLDLEMAHQ